MLSTIETTLQPLTITYLKVLNRFRTVVKRQSFNHELIYLTPIWVLTSWCFPFGSLLFKTLCDDVTIIRVMRNSPAPCFLMVYTLKSDLENWVGCVSSSTTIIKVYLQAQAGDFSVAKKWRGPRLQYTPLILTLGRQRQGEDLSSESSLVYRACSRPPRATSWEPMSKTKPVARYTTNLAVIFGISLL